MMIEGLCLPFRDACDRASDQCCRLFPCLFDPARRSSSGLKFALVTSHLIYGGILFLLDSVLIEKTRKEPWYTALYVLLFLATLAQYFLTSSSTPGYVVDAMRAVEEADFIFRKSSPTLSKGSVAVDVDTHPRGAFQGNATSWAKLAMEMYPSGSSVRSWTCTYCNVVQPPRARHCHDCDKCVLQFDHHCVFLGTCIGQGNHCRFWWYIFEETALCLWTSILYFIYLKDNILKAWWIGAIVILLLVTLSVVLCFLLMLLLFHSYLVLTNQTTFELVRRKRIPYLGGIPERVYPFSKGICRNMYNFCCAWGLVYYMESLPSPGEIEAMSRPYSCLDVLMCRCC